MTVFEFHAEQSLPRPRAEVFPFFAAAANLEALTPPFLCFRIVSPQPIKMGVGTLIDYRLKIHGIPVKWRTRIQVWEPPFRFVDAQLHGPYRQWIHEHRFEEVAGATICQDHVRYAVPGGRLINHLFVRPDIGKIFAYRRQRLAELFPAPGSGQLRD